MAFWGDDSVPSGLANIGQYLEFFHLVSGTTVSFRAFITQYEDKFSSEWNEENVFGRMDPISTFKRTGRKISLGWDVVAEDSDTAAKNLEDVSKLIRMLYPSYNTGPVGSSGQPRPSTTHISGPPLLKLRFMNLIRDAKGGGGTGSSASESGLLGYVDGFTHTPILDEGFIEIGGNDEGLSLALLPKGIKLSCTFTVLHTHDMGWDQNGVWLSESDYPYKNTMTERQQEVHDNAATLILGETDAGTLAPENILDETEAVGSGILDPPGWFGSGT